MRPLVGDRDRPRVELDLGHYALFEHDALQRIEPALVVRPAANVILVLGDLRDEERAEALEVDRAGVVEGNGDAERAALPRGLEDELAEDVGLGAGRARRLIESRPFSSWDDVQRVEGMTELVVEELKRKGAVIGPAAPQRSAFAADGREHDQLDKSIRSDTYKGGKGERD